VSSQRFSISSPMDARDQNTSDSNNSLARTESKTACAEAEIWLVSKSSSMIKRMSISRGAGFEVTKLPQTKTRRSFPLVAASSISARKRPASHIRLGDELQNRDRNSCQSAICTPGGSSPSAVNSGSTPNDSRRIRRLLLGPTLRAGRSEPGSGKCRNALRAYNAPLPKNWPND